MVTGFSCSGAPATEIAARNLSGCSWAKCQAPIAPMLNPVTAVRSGIDKGLCFAVFGCFGSQDPKLVFHAGWVPVGSDRHSAALAEGGRVADAVASIRAWVLHDPQALGGNGANLCGLTMHAVRQNRARRQRSKMQQSLQGPVVAALDGVLDIGQVLGQMNVHDGVELAA